jgi:hypothetical protein
MKNIKPGIHYYMEGERVIFTALFHIQRGQCCGNGCRHCPYNPKHKKGKVVLSEKFSKFQDMNLKDIEKQLQEIQKVDFSAMSPDQLQKIVDQLFTITEETETQLNNDIQTQIDESENS